MARICYRCGGGLEPLEPVSRNELCPKCGAYVRCCLNCEFYDEGYHNKCREPQSEPVSDRETANFCDFYRLAPAGARAVSGKNTKDARQRFEDLFAKKEK